MKELPRDLIALKLKMTFALAYPKARNVVLTAKVKLINYMRVHCRC